MLYRSACTEIRGFSVSFSKRLPPVKETSTIKAEVARQHFIARKPQAVPQHKVGRNGECWGFQQSTSPETVKWKRQLARFGVEDPLQSPAHRELVLPGRARLYYIAPYYRLGRMEGREGCHMAPMDTGSATRCQREKCHLSDLVR